MQVLLYAALGLLVFMMVLTASVQQSFNAPVEVAAAGAQVDQYRLFLFVASQYMRTYSAGAATIHWDTLKTASGIPSGAQNALMPTSWRVVAAADNSWVACTELEPRAIGALEQLAVRGGTALQRTQVGSTHYAVLGGVSDVTKAGQCP